MEIKEIWRFQIFIISSYWKMRCYGYKDLFLFENISCCVLLLLLLHDVHKYWLLNQTAIPQLVEFSTTILLCNFKSTWRGNVIDIIDSIVTYNKTAVIFFEDAFETCFYGVVKEHFTDIYKLLGLLKIILGLDYNFMLLN